MAREIVSILHDEFYTAFKAQGLNLTKELRKNGELLKLRIAIPLEFAPGRGKQVKYVETR